MTFKNKLIAGFGSAISVLVVVGVLSYQGMVQSDEDREWVTHTHQVLETINAVLRNMLDIETGERGFIVTGKATFLEPYNSGINQVAQSLKNLRELILDSPFQTKAIDLLEPMVSTRMRIAADQIEIRTREGAYTASESVSNGSGKQAMDQIRDQLSTMRQEELRLLILRSEEVNRSSWKTRIAIVGGESLGIVLLGLAGIVAGKEIGQRRRTAEEIRALNADLERRVAERTAELDERAKELARSNSELQQFAYVASHDLQEPLRMVASFTQLLAKRYGDKLDDDAREFINYAVDGATRMQTLIADLLNYSRVGTQGNPFVQTDSEAIFQKVLEGLQPNIEESGATIEKDTLPMVMADPPQIGQLFQNLLTNALKFKGANPPMIKISAKRSGMEWEISFHDNGIGIKPEHAERIFVIFQRLHTKTEYPGTGIGLAICKKIVERHGGTIWVEPSPKGGTTFCFTITAAENDKIREKKNDLRVSASAH